MPKKERAQETIKCVHFALKMPLDLRKQLMAACKKREMTMHSYVLYAIAEAIGRDYNYKFYDSLFKKNKPATISK